MQGISGDKPLFSRGRVSENEQRNLEDAESMGYLIADENSLNQTIDRYELLLSDKRSPIVSNFMNILDYHDGRDLPELTKSLNLDNRMTNYESQAIILQKITKQVERMSCGLSDI